MSPEHPKESLKPNILDIKTISNAGGKISVVESTEIFADTDIKRVYFIHDLQVGSLRGFHAHKQLVQSFIAINGSFEISLTGRDSKRQNFTLSSRSEMLRVPNGFWREFKALAPNSVLLVLASHHFDEKDYIRNFDDFLSWVE